MMLELPSAWYLLIMVLGLCGFASLALASEREGEVLLGRPVVKKQRIAFGLLGFVLLALLLWLCIYMWLPAFGTLMWFGWLTVASVALVFVITYWPWRKKQKRDERPRRNAEIVTPVATTSPWTMGARGAGGLALAALPVIFGWHLWQAEPWPVLRADAVQGEIGPWRFTLAEEERAAPEILADGTAVKHFMLRLEGDELAVARAWLRVQPPRSLRTAGMAFEGSHGNREAMIVIPPSASAQDDVWLTVQGKDGQVYQTRIAMARLSPTTADFVEGRR